MSNIKTYLKPEIKKIHDDGLYKEERIIQTPQSSIINVNGLEVINFCANNYLGLSNHPSIIQAAKDGIDKWGFGLS